MKDIIKDVTKDVIKDVIIKEALPEDAEARIAYAKQVGSETDNLSFGKEGFPISVEDEQEAIRNFSRDSKSVCYFAWKNGRLVGSGELRAFPRRMSHRAELGLTVVKAEWNSGIGSELMQKLIDYARKIHWSLLIWKCEETIAAPFICMRNSALRKWELYRRILRLGKSISTLTVWCWI